MSWKGYYVQCGNQHPMEFKNLNVQLGPGGIIQGQGTDTNGHFTVQGNFDQNQPTCKFIKQYTGQHAVYYDGRYNQQTRSIEGNWSLNIGMQGETFSIQQV